jgi:hypothetical protein
MQYQALIRLSARPQGDITSIGRGTIPVPNKLGTRENRRPVAQTFKFTEKCFTALFVTIFDNAVVSIFEKKVLY